VADRVSAPVTRSTFGGLVRDWGLAVALAIGAFVVWNLLFGMRLVTAGPAPDFRLEDLDGVEHALAEMRGQVVVLSFWATWCGYCIAEMPEISAFSRDNPEVPVLGIATDRPADPVRIGEMARRHGATYPILPDVTGEVARAYGVSTLPTTVVVDAEGQIASTRVGTLERSDLEALAARAAEKH
jgi:peroxiredoxin